MCWAGCLILGVATAALDASSAQTRHPGTVWAGPENPVGLRDTWPEVDDASVLSLRADKSAAPLKAQSEQTSTSSMRLPGPDDPVLEAEVARLRASARPGGGRSSRSQGAASWILGMLYLHGIGVALSPSEAVQWFERAYALGEPLAAAGLAWCEIDGCRSPANPGAARRWLAPLRALNPPRAQYFQWLIESRLSPLQITTPGLRGDAASKGLPNRQLLVSAARSGDIQARIELGFESLSANRLTEAEDYFRAAAAKSPAASANANLLAERIRGVGSAASSDRAARASPSDNFARAQRYHRGEGQPANYVEAIRLYQLAKNERNLPATKMLELIFSRPGADGQIDIAWMQQLAYINFSKDVPTLDSPTTRQSLSRDATPLLDLLPPSWRRHSGASVR